MMRMGENETKYTIQEEEKNRRIISFDVKIKEPDNNDQKTI